MVRQAHHDIAHHDTYNILMKQFSIIVAVDSKQGIGKNGKLPWHIPSELQHFARQTRSVKNLTAQNAVIMGRKSWDSIPDKFRPLPGRLNIVLTRSAAPSPIGAPFPPGVLIAASLDDALQQAETHHVEQIFVIGGAQVFKEALGHPACHELLVTEVEGDFECDTFFPSIDPACFKKTTTSDTHQDAGIEFRFARYERV